MLRTGAVVFADVDTHRGDNQWRGSSSGLVMHTKITSYFEIPSISVEAKKAFSSLIFLGWEDVFQVCVSILWNYPKTEQKWLSRLLAPDVIGTRMLDTAMLNTFRHPQRRTSIAEKLPLRIPRRQ